MTSALHGSAGSQARSRTSRGRSAPHKLLVLGVDVPDSVRRAGGLICDAVRAGLTVQVYLESCDDDLALRILGVNATVLPDAFDVEHGPDAIYFAAALYERNRAVRRLVSSAARRRSADVAAWGGTQWLGTAPELAVAHRLSSAAQMFKLHAVRAAGGPTQVSPVESFHCGQRRSIDAMPFPNN